MNVADQQTALVDGVRRHAARASRAPALRFGDDVWSYGELDAACDRVARALVASTRQPGSRVCYLGKNSDVFIQLLFGSMRSRRCVAPINWRQTPREILALIVDAEAEILFVEAAFVQHISGLTDRSDAPLQVVVIGDRLDGRPNFDAWLEDAGDATLPAPDDEEAFLQLYTSGTTGRPKGVMMGLGRYSAHLARLEAADWWLGYTSSDVVLIAMPFFHLSGCVPTLDAFAGGAELVVLPEFETARVVDAILAHQVTRAFVVPAALQLMIADERFHRADRPRLALRSIGYGASPIDAALLKKAIATLGCGFAHFYGMTESLTYITGLAPEDHDPALGPRSRSVGRALTGLDLRIADPDGRPVAGGTVGEIQIRAPFVTQGYWRQPEETAKLFTTDGWLKTGDAGRLDDEGFVYIEDRLRDMIISGGENVYPLEVETVVTSHPSVAEAAVVGAPDERWGEKVVAFVVASDGHRLDAVELGEWVRDRLAHYKCPKDWMIVAALPRNASGKVLRRTLRDQISERATT